MGFSSPPGLAHRVIGLLKGHAPLAAVAANCGDFGLTWRPMGLWAPVKPARFCGRAKALFTEKFEWNLFYCDLIIQSESNPLVNPIIWR